MSMVSGGLGFRVKYTLKYQRISLLPSAMVAMYPPQNTLLPSERSQSDEDRSSKCNLAEVRELLS